MVNNAERKYTKSVFRYLALGQDVPLLEALVVMQLPLPGGLLPPLYPV